MKQLLLLRHAKAVPSSPSGDFERELAPRGRKDASRMGVYLQAEGLVPQQILASPARRTQETASLVREALGDAPPLESPRALYLAEPHTILEAIRSAEPETERLLVVGHNPGIAELAELITVSGNLQARALVQQKYPTAALAVISLDIEVWQGASFHSGRLDRFLTPKTLP